MRKLIIGLVLVSALFAQHGSDFVVGRMQLNTIYHGFGGFQDSAVSLAGTQDTWDKVGNATGNLWGGIEADGISFSDDTLIFANPGDYFGIASVSFSGQNANEYEFRIYETTGTAVQGFHKGVSGTGAGNYVPIVLPFYLEDVTATKRYIMQMTNTSGNNAATVRYGEFWVIYLHD